MRTVYREKRYYCGDYLDAYVYPVFEDGKRTGKRVRHRHSTPAQTKLNQRHSREKLVRLLHANFSPSDLEIHLTYEDEPTEDEAKRKLSNFLRCLRRYRRSHGLGDLKYVAVTERGKRNDRIHHHITLNGGIGRDELEHLWKHGYANSRRLQFGPNGIAALGYYVTKSPLGAKAWNASKNLVHPEPKTRDGRISARTARELARGQDSARLEALYPGYLVAHVESFQNDVNGGFYLAARLYKKNTKFRN